MLNYMVKKTKHIPSKIKREALRIPVLQSLSKRNYQTAVNQYASRLPVISSADSALVDSIREEGVFVTSLEDLAINSTSLMIDNPFLLYFSFIAQCYVVTLMMPNVQY